LDILVDPRLRSLLAEFAASPLRKHGGAGIDHGEAVWKALGVQDTTVLEWRFLDPAELVVGRT